MLPGAPVHVGPVRNPRARGPPRLAQHRQAVAHAQLGGFVARRPHRRPGAPQRRQTQVAVFGWDSDGRRAVARGLFRVALGAVSVVLHVTCVTRTIEKGWVI